MPSHLSVNCNLVIHLYRLSCSHILSMTIMQPFHKIKFHGRSVPYFGIRNTIIRVQKYPGNSFTILALCSLLLELRIFLTLFAVHVSYDLEGFARSPHQRSWKGTLKSTFKGQNQCKSGWFSILWAAIKELGNNSEQSWICCCPEHKLYVLNTRFKHVLYNTIRAYVLF